MCIIELAPAAGERGWQTGAVVSPERADEVRQVVDTVHRWAVGRADVRGVLVVGSWARDAARMDSDVDIVVVSDAHPDAHAEPATWTRLLGGDVVREQDWGPLREIRVRRPSGFEVEIGVVPVGWAATDPVDPGTYRVISDGHRVVYDPAGILATLSRACR